MKQSERLPVPRRKGESDVPYPRLVQLRCRQCRCRPSRRRGVPWLRGALLRHLGL
uniref:Uncharacterized protein n=1 Tax=uncultured marine virus TaxID=186617 RepID=A0A0F7L5S5_9VIRU|nr:hypothetical protein [uncultured marine virus]